jgi:hypothetical protein
MYNVYLISSDEQGQKKYKIGYTKNNVEKRLKQLKTGNSNDLTIEKVFNSKWGTKIEAILHRKYSNSKISGEWFYLSEKEVSLFDSDCKNLEEYFKTTLNSSTFENPKTFLV